MTEFVGCETAVERIAGNGREFEVLTAGRGDRLALCLHGFPEHAVSWRHQIPFLVKRGYRVWAPNQRGYGASARPRRTADYTIDALVADIAGLVDAAGAREIVLLGHDWGAVVAWFFAMRRTRPLSKLVIANVPHPAVFLDVLRTSWRQRAMSWYVLFFQLPWLPEALLGANGARVIGEAFVRPSDDPARFPPELLAFYRSEASRPGALRAMLNWYRANARGGFAAQTAQGFPVIDVPTQMIWGEDDVALGKETTYGTERYVSDLRIAYLPGVSHWVQQEAPERFNTILASFL